MKTAFQAFLILLVFLISTRNHLTSQSLCIPAQATSPGNYNSVDPPTFTFIPPIGSSCVFVEIGNALPSDCNIYFLIGCINATAYVTDTCVLLSNSSWNYCYSPNVQYCWKIHTNGAGNTWQAGGGIMRLAGALPTVNLISPANGATNIVKTPMITWSHIDSASNYKLSIYTDKCCLNKILDSITVRDSIQVASGKLNWNTTYWWRVKPYKAGGEGPFSDPFTFTTSAPQIPPIPAPASPPNGVIGMPLTDTLQWSSSAGAESYRLQLAIDAAFNNLILNDSTLTVTSRIVNGLTQLTTYYWRVYAKNSAGISSWSPTWNFRTMGTPQQVTLVSPANNSVNIPTTYNFNWRKAVDQTMKLFASNYWFEMVSDTITNANLLIDSTLTDTSRTVNGMNTNTTYYWRVKAKNQIGWGNFSARFKFTTLPPIPGVPTLILPVNNATNVPTTYTFKWSKAIDQLTKLAISNYWFEMVSDTVTNANLLRDSSLTDTTRLVTGMNNNTTYFWRVKAKNQTGWSSFSARNKFTTVPAVPAAPSLIAPANNSSGQSLTPKLDWTVVTGTNGYRVQVSADSTFSAAEFDSSNVPVDSIRIPTGKLINNTKYFWRVNATNAGGAGPWSAVWNFRTSLLGVTNIPGELPILFKLYTNYPNPFNPTTKIKFDIPKTAEVSVQIYNVLGAVVTDLVNESGLSAGSYEIEWNGSNYASGIYYYRITAGSFSDVKKMVLIK